MLLSTRSRSNRPVTKSAFSTQTPSLTTKLAFSAATSKIFRLRRHGLPLRQGGCLPAPTPKAAERANSSTVHAPPRPWALGLENLKPAAPGQCKKSKQTPKATCITRSPELLSLCGAPELARGIGRRERERDDLVRSIASSEQNADVPRGVRLLLARSPSLRCSHEGVR